MTKRVFFLWITTLLFACTSCQSLQSEKTDPAVPTIQELSPSAQQLYYYLVINKAFINNDKAAILEALQGLVSADPSLEIYSNVGSILLSNKEYSIAINVLQQGLKKFPENSTLTFMYTTALNAVGRSAQAQSILEAYTQKHPSDQDAKMELFYLAVQNGDLKTAKKLLNNLPALPKVDAMLLTARLHSEQGQYAQARAGLQTLLNSYPNRSDIWMELAGIAEKEEKFDEAAGYYRKALQLNPTDTSLQTFIVQFYLKIKQPAQALAFIRSQPRPADYLVYLAGFFAENTFYPEAELLLQQAADEGADENAIKVCQAFIVFQTTGNAKNTFALLESIPADSEFAIEANEKILQLLNATQKFKEVVERSQKLQKEFPNNTLFIRFEVNALLQMKKHSAAEKRIKKACRDFPQEEQDLLFFWGSIEHESGYVDDSIRTMRRLVQINPNHALALNFLGYSLVEINQELPEAKELLVRALQIEPDNYYIIDSLAWAQYKLGEFKDAWATINRCVTLQPQISVVWDHYADIASALQLYEEARIGYDKALEYNPEDPESIETKRNNLPGRQ